jgi:hypothetical protein
MTETSSTNCNHNTALNLRIDAIEKMAQEREDRNKERIESIKAATAIALSSVERSFENIKEATALAQGTMEKRLDGMNEFRDALKDQTMNSPTREELNRVVEDIKVMGGRFLDKALYDTQHEQLRQQVNHNTNRLYEIEKFISSIANIKEEKRQGVTQTYYGMAMVGVGFSVLTSLAGIIFTMITYFHQ